MKNTKMFLGAFALAALLVGCDNTEVKSMEYYEKHLDEAEKVFKQCDFDKLNENSNAYKNCKNAKDVYKFNEDKKFFSGRK
jgi:lipoprotein